MESCTSYPEFSAIALGIISNASANEDTPNLARPSALSKLSRRYFAQPTSYAPAPGTPYQGRAVNKGPPSIVCIAEHKGANHDPNKGLRLLTSHVRRGYAASQDQKLNSHSKINCITACISAQKAGFDEALILDPHGQVATCNSVHFFIVRNGEVWTSGGNYCIP